MSRSPKVDEPLDRWPRWWRLMLVALSTLILCSCRAPDRRVSHAAPASDTLPEQAWTGAPGAPGVPAAEGQPCSGEQPLPLPETATSAWIPPGIAPPWPGEEYLRDGGQRGPIRVASDGQVKGLQLEDTIAHYDTLDGRTLVEPSNRVDIYAPRFGAVRSVASVVQNEQMDRLADVHLPTRLVRHDEVQRAVTDLQNAQPINGIGTRKAGAYRGRQTDGAMSSALGPAGFRDAFLAYENLSIIRNGTFEQTEKANLAIGTTAAITWSHDQAVQVILDRKMANEVVGDRRAQATFTVDEPPANPSLRIIKVASTPYARPGEEIDFTLRFDNLGNQPIGNVTIIDNLTTRLEYVADSAQSSVKAAFSTERNEGDSLALRWEIAEPMKPGDGGIVRFRCKVR
jgi:uncharacterized repeat protein (TIGR01451 family)